MDPRSSLHGVQCVKNLSSPLERARDRSVNRFILAEMAWPCFKASFTFDLYSLGSVVVCCAKNLNMLLPTKSWLLLLVIPKMSTMPRE